MMSTIAILDRCGIIYLLNTLVTSFVLGRNAYQWAQQPTRYRAGFFMRMRDHISYIGRFIILDIVDPIFETDTYSRVMINKEYVQKAKESSRLLVIQTPKGEKIYFPDQFKKMKITEKVFLRPDEPMKMYTLDILHCEKKPREFFEVS